MLFMFYTVRAITPQFFFHSAHRGYATHVPMAPPGHLPAAQSTADAVIRMPGSLG
jgi:hypothetical protein